MASVSFAAVDIRPLPGAVVVRLVAASACTPGDAVYVDSNGKAELADADALASAKLFGVICAGVEGKVLFAAGDSVDVAAFGPVAGFSSLTPGAWLYASTTAGDISDAVPAPASGDYVYVLGTCLSAAKVFVNPFTYDIAAQ